MDEYLTILMSNGDNWFVSENDDVNIEKKSYAKKKEDIKYKIFDDASNYVQDEFWKIMLKNASLNKFKRGFKFMSGVLTYKSKNKIISHNLNLDSPEETMKSFIYFMREECGVFSEEDKQIKTKEIKKTLINNKPNSVNSWSKIKTYIQKNIIINKYLNKLKEENNLNSVQYRQLKNKIMIGIISGFFNAKTIIVEDSEIVDIIGLVRNDNGNYIIDKSNINISFKEYKEKNCQEYTDTVDSHQQIVQNCKFTYTKVIVDFFEKLEKVRDKD